MPGVRSFTRTTHVIATLAVLGQRGTTLSAQWIRPPESGGRIYSIGQPKRIHWQAGLSSGVWFEGPGSALLVRAEGGVSRSIASPVVGALDVGLEGFVGLRETSLDGGGRLLFNVPYFGMGVGAEYNIPDRHVNLIVSARTPVRRGGIIAPGGLLRINWYPMESHGFTIGVSLPFGDPLAGRTRPIRDYVVVSNGFERPVPYQVHNAELEAVLDSLAVSARWVRQLTVPFLDQDGRDTRTAEARAGAYLSALRSHLAVRNSDQESRYFRAQLERAFRLAAGSDSLASSLSAAARRILLDEVILPYNSLLGQKKKGDELVELGIAARGRFSRAVLATSLAPGAATEPVLYVFQRLTELLEVERARAAKEWDDPRLVWLPLQYVLQPEDYDSQEELDALLERFTRVKFTDQNQVWYLAGLQFHRELLRTIRETEAYHVLWIHDFPALTDDGRLDWAAMDQVVDGYLATLARRLRAYDGTGTLPAFFIFLDEHYYEARKSHIWMTILENPLHASAEIPGATAEERARVASALEEVRTAARGSRLLQAEARQYGDAWLRNRVKVHVNITNRADPSFWGGGLVSSVFGYPDNLMRDHRKIVFRDVTEADPFRGEALFTGMGVGQQYIGPSWDDRAVMVRGPALRDLKRSARDLLLSQGTTEADLPLFFRLQPLPSDWDARLAEGGRRAGFGTRALQLSNGTGYLPKPLNVGKALLYSLLPGGSMIKIPDSLWNSFLYAGLLAGACLRGADVLIVSPAQNNAPSAAAPTLARAWELASRLLMARDTLAGPLAAAGGMLQVGLYTLPPDQRGLASRAQTWLELVTQTVFLKGLMPFYDMVEPAVADEATHPGAATFVPPKLHQKVQFLASPGLWAAIERAPEWPEFMAAYLRYREATYQTQNTAMKAELLPAELSEIAERIYRRARGKPGVAGYAFVGSQNQDYRGMFMDGEVAMVFSGPEALVPLVDLAFLEGTVRWLERRATLDSLLPPPSEYLRRMTRITKDGI